MADSKKALHDAETENGGNVEPNFTFEEWANDVRKMSGRDAILPRQPGEFTIKETAEAMGESWEITRRMLNRLADEGKLERNLRIVNGYRTHCYKKK